MDTITHGIAGALIGKAFFADNPAVGAPSWWQRPRTEDRVAIICAALGAMFPDIDVFFPLFSRRNLAFLTMHRGMTHSLLMLIVWAAGLALLAGWLSRLAKWPAPEFAQLFSIFGAALASHILLDLLTPWGTMVWSPVDHTRMSWDSLFIVDLALSSIVLLPQVAAWVHGPGKRPAWLALAAWLLFSGAMFAVAPLARSLDVPFPDEAAAGAALVFGAFLLIPLRHRGHSKLGRVSWARIGMTLFAGYIGFAAGMHAVALNQLRQYAVDGHIEYDNIAAFPQPPWPGRWAGLISAGPNTFRIQFNLIGGELPRLNVYPNASNEYVSKVRAMPDVQTFLWFARFPVFTYLERDGHPVVQISDAQFIGPQRRMPGSNFSSPATNFTYEVVFGPDGGVLSSGLLSMR
jgi:membrane-bound metal-dependent hydrolase YbcI (DUF457 family)